MASENKPAEQPVYEDIENTPEGDVQTEVEL